MATRRIGNININYTVPEAQTQIYNAIGRDTGEQTTGTGDNFFTKRAKSIGNAVGTTGAALYETGGNLIGAAIAGLTGGNYTSHRSKIENEKTEKARQDARENMNNVARKYGYNTYQDVWDAREAALKAGDQELLDKIDNVISPELQAQSGAGDNSLSERSAEYDDYRNNNFVSKQINQDPGKFAGSAINTLSTGLDLTGITAGPLGNAIQGGVEGFADELEQNGLQNFDWNRAGQNALVGAATGAVTGALNKGISNKLAKNGGNLFKGGNALTSGINKLGSKTALGRIGSTLATGAARGAISGAVGGATGAGLSSALQGADLGTGISNALQGAVQGAGQGAVTGGIMAGANMAISKTPGIGKFYNDLQTSKQRWDQSGSNFDERLTNTLNSGESGIGNWLNKRTQSKVLNAAGRLGNSIRDVNDETVERWANGEINEKATAKNKARLADNKANGKQRLAEAKKIANDSKEYQSLLRDMANRTEELSKQYTSYGGRPWSEDAYTEYEAIDPKLLSALSISSDLDGARAAAVTQILRERGLIPDTTTVDSPAIRGLKTQKEYIAKANQINDDIERQIGGKLERPINQLDVASNDQFIFVNGEDGNEYTYDKTNGQLTMTDPKTGDQVYVSESPTTAIPNKNDYIKKAMANGATYDEALLDYMDIESGAFVPSKDTPTTAKGWLKKAGQRIVEDANNRGVGLSIKDVGDDQNYSDAYNSGMDQGLSGGELGDEIADFSGLPKNISGSDLYKLSQSDPDVRDAVNYVASELIDAGERPTYDQVANDYWDEVRAQYAQSQNYQGPGNYYESTSNESPETEVYRTVTGNTGSQWDAVAQEAGYATYDDAIRAFVKANPNAQVSAGSVLTWLDNNPGNWNPNTARTNLDEVFEPEARNQIVNKNKAQALGQQLQNVSKQQKYRALYDSLDAKTAQRAVETNAPETLADLDIKPENYLEAAKTSNYVNQVVSDLADESNVRVNIPDMTDRLEAAIEDVILTDNAAKKYTQTIRQIVADGSTPDEYTAGYLIEKSRELGNKAASLRGNTDDVNTLRAAYTNAKYVLRDEAANALANANITGTNTNQKIADGLDKIGANQKVINYYTALNADGSAPTAKDYIRRSALFEQARDMGTQVRAEQLTRSASKQPTNWATRLYRASGLDQPLEIVLNNTVAPIAGAATKIAGKAIEGVGNLGAKIAGGKTTTSTPAATKTTTVTPQTQIYNALGRTEGAINAEEARAAQYLTDAAQNLSAESGYAAPLGVSTTTSSLEDLAATSTPATSTSVYNTLSGNQSSGSYFPTSGDYWTDLLGTALSLALDADDAEAFGSLYTMYQNALAKQESTTTSATKLTDKQRQANAAALALDDFAQAESNFAYDVSDIPVLGTIANLGGNDYQSKAEALALQVGYMLSGATVNKEEAKKIGMAYVPQPRDNATVRQNKINQLRGIISEYQRSSAS